MFVFVRTSLPSVGTVTTSDQEKISHQFIFSCTDQYSPVQLSHSVGKNLFLQYWKWGFWRILRTTLILKVTHISWYIWKRGWFQSTDLKYRFRHCEKGVKLFTCEKFKWSFEIEVDFKMCKNRSPFSWQELFAWNQWLTSSQLWNQGWCTSWVAFKIRVVSKMSQNCVLKSTLISS